MTIAEDALTALDLETALREVLTHDSPTQVRVARARTTVRFDVRGAPERSTTLLLDRRPPEVVAGDREPAEITISLTADQATALARGELLLPIALLHGLVRSSGPVRKYLAVEPILRAALRDRWQDA